MTDEELSKIERRWRGAAEASVVFEDVHEHVRKLIAALREAYARVAELERSAVEEKKLQQRKDRVYDERADTLRTRVAELENVIAENAASDLTFRERNADEIAEKIAAWVKRLPGPHGIIWYAIASEIRAGAWKAGAK